MGTRTPTRSTATPTAGVASAATTAPTLTARERAERAQWVSAAIALSSTPTVLMPPPIITNDTTKPATTSEVGKLPAIRSPLRGDVGLVLPRYPAPGGSRAISTATPRGACTGPAWNTL